ncbi:NWD1-like protein [Mya arenaria]|uniref:NWD1-like protein n=1 Tax=Mya arenaria TaxID=6604 RepID=A0ABY7DH85_MYAAR|nr:NWD1-like protein [Mya arenaria]
MSARQEQATPTNTKKPPPKRASSFQGIPEKLRVQGATTKQSTKTKGTRYAVPKKETFARKDMRAERNTLAREVYPYLRDHCAQKGMDFQVVDMRWGITEESQNDHSVEKICLQEVDNCQKSSLGVNFVVLSGDRYGFRPIPTEMDVKLFECLRFEATKLKLKDQELLDTWYLKDENAVPSLSKFTFFGDFSPGCDELRKKDTTAWYETYGQLQVVLRKAATEAHKDGKITAQEKEQFFISVTECEIQDGILKASDVDSHCLVYKRYFKGLDDTTAGDKNASRYMDVQTTDKGVFIDDEVKYYRKLLFDQKIKGKLQKENIKSYTIRWNQQGVCPTVEEHELYLAEFCQNFTKDCMRLIDIAHEKRQPLINARNYYTDYYEIVHHLKFCKKKCESFCGQQGGKSHTRLIRFLGTTPNTQNVFDVLFSVLGQVADHCDMIIPPINYKTMAKLQRYAPRHLRQVGKAAKEPVVILLDSIDQMDGNYDSYSMKWLPMALPSNVKIIISTLPKEHGILTNLKQLLPDSKCYIEVPMVSETTGKDIINMYLEKQHRQITETQMSMLLSVFKGSPKPLFLKIIVDEARLWNSFTTMSDISLPTTVKEAINKMFEKLETKFGQTLVSHALGYITVGLSGITEFEIEDVLSCDDAVLNVVYKFHDPPVPGIVRIPPVLWARIRYDIKEYLVERLSHGRTTLNWYHRQFIETARERYTTNDKDAELHRNLADIFLQENGLQRSIRLTNRNNLVMENADRQVTPQPFTSENRRKLACLPYHVSRASRLLGSQFVKQKILCNFKFLSTRIGAFSVSTVLQDLQGFLDKQPDREVEHLKAFINVCKNNIALSVSFAFYIVSALNPASYEECLLMLVDDAREHLQNQKRPSLIPRFPCMAMRNDTSDAVISSMSGITKIENHSQNALLLKTHKEKEEDEDRSTYEVFYTDTQESVPVELKKDIVRSKIHMNGDLLYYLTDNSVVCNFRGNETDEYMFNLLIPNWGNNKENPKEFAYNQETKHGAIVFDSCIVLVDLSNMSFVQKFIPKNPLARFVTCYVLNDEKIVALGIIANSNEDDDRVPTNSSFICSFDLDKDGPVAMYETDKRFDLETKSLSNFDQTLAIATKGCGCLQGQEREDDGKTTDPRSSELLLFQLRDLCLVNTFGKYGNAICIHGDQSKAAFVVLNTEGTVYLVTQAYDRKVRLPYPILDVAVLWERDIWLLVTRGGDITLYNPSENKKLGSFKAYTVQVKDIEILDRTCITLGSNMELKAWSVDALLELIRESDEKSVAADATLLQQDNVTAMAVSLDEKLLFTCKEDSSLRIWNNESLTTKQMINVGIVGNILHPLPNCIIVHDTTQGKLKVFDFFGNLIFKPPDSMVNIMFSSLNSTNLKLYAISAQQKGREQIDEIDIEKMQHVRSTRLQQKLTYESIDFKLSERDRYLIIRSRISENEFESIKAMLKKGGLQEQPFRHKYHAVDLDTGNGTLIPCCRRLSKIPFLGNEYLSIGPSTVFVSTRQWVCFWDIPIGKCGQRHCRETKEPMFYRPTWCGEKCEGWNSVLELDSLRSCIAVGSEDGYMMVYNVTTGIPPKKIKPATKHSAKVVKIAISPDGRWIASACANNILKLWDFETVTECFSTALDATVREMIFNKNGTKLTLFTGDDSTRVMVFDVHG